MVYSINHDENRGSIEACRLSGRLRAVSGYNHDENRGSIEAIMIWFRPELIQSISTMKIVAPLKLSDIDLPLIYSQFV